jgi:hypothetical protein
MSKNTNDIVMQTSGRNNKYMKQLVTLKLK